MYNTCARIEVLIMHIAQLSNHEIYFTLTTSWLSLKAVKAHTHLDQGI